MLFRSVESSAEGCSFTLGINGEKVNAHTKLLGEHSAYNIALAAQVASLLGMKTADIAAAIPQIDYIEHRLQLIKSGGINVLDDGYNSNVRGAAAAISALKKFGGKKIVVTPGLVELGVLEKSENYALGGELVGLDFVILVGERLVEPVKQGYLEKGGDPEKLKVVLGLEAAKAELQKVIGQGDAVLFLNDLPDAY